MVVNFGDIMLIRRYSMHYEACFAYFGYSVKNNLTWFLPGLQPILPLPSEDISQLSPLPWCILKTACHCGYFISLQYSQDGAL
jgi:hypothetical protein